MTRKQYTSRGFVLIMTMVCFAVLALMILTLMKRMIFSLQTQDLVRTRHQAFYALESTAEKIAANLAVSHLECVVYPNNLPHINASWLRERGCLFSHNLNTPEASSDILYYILVDIGVFPCLHLKSVQNYSGSHHWWVIVSNERLPHKSLWLRVAVPEKTSICSNASLSHMIESKLSWHLQS